MGIVPLKRSSYLRPLEMLLDIFKQNINSFSNNSIPDSIYYLGYIPEDPFVLSWQHLGVYNKDMLDAIEKANTEFCPFFCGTYKPIIDLLSVTCIDKCKHLLEDKALIDYGPAFPGYLKALVKMNATDIAFFNRMFNEGNF